MFTWTMAVPLLLVLPGEWRCPRLVHWAAPGLRGLLYRLAVIMVRIV